MKGRNDLKIKSWSVLKPYPLQAPNTGVNEMREEKENESKISNKTISQIGDIIDLTSSHGHLVRPSLPPQGGSEGWSCSAEDPDHLQAL